MTRVLLAVLALALIFPGALPSTASAQPTPMVTVILGVSYSFNEGSIELLGGEVVYRADLAPVVVARVPLDSLIALGRLPGVLSVGLDGPVYLLEEPLQPPRRNGPVAEQPPQTVPWGIEYINATDAWAYTSGSADVNGDGEPDIEVAIIDTGVDRDHPDLQANIAWGKAVLNGRISDNFEDRNGHGTHVAGTVAALNNEIGVVGAAPEVQLYIIKALNDGGLGSWSDLVIAIDLAVKGPDGVIDSDGDGVVAGDPDDDAPEVISMSLGGSNPPPALKDVVAAAYGYGVVLVAAAGNEGDIEPTYPAKYPEVIAVGAIDSSEATPDWSNRNPELAAPGVDILSTYKGGSYETLSGTSMATPHVSGTVALIQAAALEAKGVVLPPGTEDDLTTDTVRGILHTTAKDLGPQGKDAETGYGAVNALAAVEAVLG